MEEESLVEELKQYQEKSHHIDLVYKKVIRNVKHISKNYENSSHIAENTNSNDSIELIKTETDNNHLEKIKSKNKNAEDNVIKKYEEYLKQIKNEFMEYLNNNTKEEFINLMKDEGLKNNANENDKKSKKKVNNMRISASDLKPITDHNVEYDYSDNNVYDEELEIKKDYDDLAREFKEKVN